MGTPIPMSRPQGRFSALALAAAVALSFATFDAHALARGRVTVQSALGEPLRAEIDLPEINAEEVSSLRAAIASPAAYRAAGLELNPALGNAEISLQKRPDGRKRSPPAQRGGVPHPVCAQKRASRAGPRCTGR